MLRRLDHTPDLVSLVSPLLLELGVAHAFTTQLTGGAASDDSLAALLALLGLPPGGLERVRQVHGGVVQRVSDGRGAAGQPQDWPSADALVCGLPGRAVAVVTADCVPVLLADAEGRRVAAVHAGWRGLLAGVIPATLAALGGARAAAIGPCLCSSHFEVGPEVARAFVAAGYAEQVRPGAGDRSHVDLGGVAGRQLSAGGVRALDSTDLCTYEHAELFCSHRRDVTHAGAQRTGRQLAIIAPARGG